MIRLNIKKNGLINVKSFTEKKDLEHYLFKMAIKSKRIFTVLENPSNEIWNGNVAQSFNFDGYIISISAKSADHNSMLGANNG